MLANILISFLTNITKRLQFHGRQRTHCEFDLTAPLKVFPFAANHRKNEATFQSNFNTKTFFMNFKQFAFVSELSFCDTHSEAEKEKSNYNFSRFSTSMKMLGRFEASARYEFKQLNFDGCRMRSRDRLPRSTQ